MGSIVEYQDQLQHGLNTPLPALHGCSEFAWPIAGSGTISAAW